MKDARLESGAPPGQIRAPAVWSAHPPSADDPAVRVRAVHQSQHGTQHNRQSQSHPQTRGGATSGRRRAVCCAPQTAQHRSRAPGDSWREARRQEGSVELIYPQLELPPIPSRTVRVHPENKIPSYFRSSRSRSAYSSRSDPLTTKQILFSLNGRRATRKAEQSPFTPHRAASYPAYRNVGEGRGTAESLSAHNGSL